MGRRANTAIYEAVLDRIQMLPHRELLRFAEELTTRLVDQGYESIPANVMADALVDSAELLEGGDGRDS